MTTSSTAYVMALTVGDIFADGTYQRPIDVTRARKMAQEWDRRLAGVIEVSDRGENAQPRYAVIDGQHRWEAARSLVEPPLIVANVHEGLSLADEAALFDKLNRQRKQITTWDHWRARRAAGESAVESIEQVARKHHLVVDTSAQDGCVSCTSTLERVVKLGGLDLLDESLSLLTNIWGLRRDAFDAPVIHGIALILHNLYEDVDEERLADALLDTVPRRIAAQAQQLKEFTRGTLPLLYALAMIGAYNKKPGRKIQVDAKSFGGGSRNARSAPSFPEKYGELKECGFQDWEIAKKLDIQLCSLVRQLERYGMKISPNLAELAVEERDKRRAAS